MSLIRKIPVLRALHRYHREITRPAPLEEFDDYDEYWSSRVADGRRAQELDRHRVIASLLRDDASVLDVGCGDGAFLRYLKRHKPGCRLLGADISSVAIDALAEAGVAGQVIDPARPLAEQVPARWDAVVLMEVIEHVPDAETLIRQVLELAPARIFITIPNAGFLMHRLRLLLGGRFPITSIFYHMKEHVRFWTLKDFYQWAHQLNLRVVSHHAQVDEGDRVVRWLARSVPGLFADRMVYEVAPTSNLAETSN